MNKKIYTQWQVFIIPMEKNKTEEGAWQPWKGLLLTTSDQGGHSEGSI